MNSINLSKLEADLWEAADQLRANSKLTAAEYSNPVLGLIFLRHAYNRFLVIKNKIEESLPEVKGRGKRPINKNDFLKEKAIFLPEKAQFDFLLNLPEREDIGEAINEAMKAIENEYPNLLGVLPKNYNIFEKDLLKELLRIFDRESIRNAKGDLFGKIYEYFLNEFAMSGAQEGGEFFTPVSLVNTIVNVIQPDHGIIFDPACGSGGMFVQTGHLIEEEGFEPNEKITVYGQEKTETNTKLAKMNMAVHGLEAKILEGNTFYEDKHNLVGKCDFVMANPPFNVDGVDKEKDFVKKDSRLPFGLPKNDNANYMWIQYFYSYLKPTGRAGFVMASSASDAGHSEKLIRQKLVETGAVDVMISIGTNFFYTRSLPCTLWFFDRAKEKDKARKDKTLMLDARNIYHVVNRKVHDFSPEQLKNITTIVELYRENNAKYIQTVKGYMERYFAAAKELAALPECTISKDLKDFIKNNEITTQNNKQLKVNEKFQELITALKDFRKQYEKQAKATLETIKNKQEKTDLENKNKLILGLIHDTIYFHNQCHWLQSKFPDGKYVDVAGLCKVVTTKDVAANDYSLTAGRYVGVAPSTDDDFDYEARLSEIKIELVDLNKEAQELAKVIQKNFEELGI